MNYKEKLNDFKRNEMPYLYEVLMKDGRSKSHGSCRVMLSRFRNGLSSSKIQSKIEEIIDNVHNELVVCRNIDGLEFDVKGVIVGRSDGKDVYIEYTKLMKFKIELDQCIFDMHDIDYIMKNARERVLEMGFENRDGLKLLIAKYILNQDKND